MFQISLICRRNFSTASTTAGLSKCNAAQTPLYGYVAHKTTIEFVSFYKSDKFITFLLTIRTTSDIIVT